MLNVDVWKQKYSLSVRRDSLPGSSAMLWERELPSPTGDSSWCTSCSGAQLNSWCRVSSAVVTMLWSESPVKWRHSLYTCLPQEESIQRDVLLLRDVLFVCVWPSLHPNALTKLCTQVLGHKVVNCWAKPLELFRNGWHFKYSKNI